MQILESIKIKNKELLVINSLFITVVECDYSGSSMSSV